MRALFLSCLLFLSSLPILRLDAQTDSMNSLFIISPYRLHGTWVFDDPRVELREEPFVAGADTILDHLSAKIPGAEKGFRLIFSAKPFPGFQAHFERRRAEHEGTWYWSPDFGMEGWLCPALFKYFDAAPETLYVKAEPKD